MRAFGRLCLVCCVLFLTAHPLPAPISEENVSPTPSPKKDIATATPKAAATASIAVPVSDSAAKPAPNAAEAVNRRPRHAEKIKRVAQPETAISPTPAATSQNIFDGTWKGSINLVPARNWHGTGRLIGTFNIELAVAGDGTSITEHYRSTSISERTERDGKTIRWQSSIFHDVSCSLTPNPDGKTALVMFRNDFYGEPTGIFTRSGSIP